ncbi:Enhanced downy mildew [Thalictrum thalictroides]|uniref:Enhanced downy mildew n=1 Tax=Thalictrum thalictroides TaxID=46969 RepID=A0A7J6X3F8_THATH|nr:Enhanced downy mildew [Thalictrum thalictroides]
MNRTIGLQSAFLHFSSCSSSSSSSNNNKINSPRINELLSSSTYKTLFDNICKESITDSSSTTEELRSWRRMDFADDEVEAVAQSVTDYYFEDDQDEPISFAALPIRWSRSATSASDEKHIFLHGTVVSGSERIYKKVIAWAFEYSNDRPEVSVLSTDKRWIKLQKPRKSFEDTLRTILITIQCFHFLKKHPDKSESCMWRHLEEAFSFYKVKPSANDVLNHLPLIQSAIGRDRTLEKSVGTAIFPYFAFSSDSSLFKQFIHTILSYAKKRKVLDEDVHHDLAVKKANLITEKVLMEQTEAANRHLDLSDTLCAFCDNGGELLCCEGRCLRAFHATVDADFGCKSLRLSKDQLHAPKFLCKNCQYKKHQCFACGKLGSSDRANNAVV